jgi:protein FAM32A
LNRKKKKKSSKSSKHKLEQALNEEKGQQQKYQYIEKTEAERKFEEIKRQRVTFFTY